MHFFPHLSLRSFSTILLVFGSTVLSMGQSIPFQGILKDSSDVPLDGTYHIQFELYDAVTVGNKVGSTLALLNTTITGGFVNTSLGFGDVFANGDLWLEISVEEVGSGSGFEKIDPRTPILWSPRATTAARVGSLMVLVDSPVQGIDFRSPYDVRFHLDDDNDDAQEWFSVFNGADDVLLRLTEVGNLMALNGSGNNAIQFPASSISSVENANEPGIVSGVGGTFALSAGVVTTVASATITSPTPGYVLAFVSLFATSGAAGSYFSLGIETVLVGWTA